MINKTQMLTGIIFAMAIVIFQVIKPDISAGEKRVEGKSIQLLKQEHKPVTNSTKKIMNINKTNSTDSKNNKTIIMNLIEKAKNMPGIQFFKSIGIVFGSGFIVLTVIWFYLALRIKEQSKFGIKISLDYMIDTIHTNKTKWCYLINQKSSLIAKSEKTGLIGAAISTWGLVGTVSGMFHAIRHAQTGIGGSNSLSLIKTLFSGGIASSLSTTIIAQFLFMLLILLWAWFVADDYEAAINHFDEAINYVKPQLNNTTGNNNRTSPQKQISLPLIQTTHRGGEYE